MSRFFLQLFSERTYRRWTQPAEIALTAFLLGVIGTLALGLIVLYFLGVLGLWAYAAGAYLLVVQVWFHMSEFMVAAQYRLHECSPEAFLIFHSPAYVAAHAVAWTEFAVETFLVPDSWKWTAVMTPTTITIGILGVLFCYGFRVVAMVQCGSNFALQIEHQRREEHKLVRDGVYRYFRHPAYVGWFYNAMFSQLVLGNPISLVGFTVVTWYFFYERIPYEEHQLRSAEFFGAEYDDFKKQTVIGIPFIRT